MKISVLMLLSIFILAWKPAPGDRYDLQYSDEKSFSPQTDIIALDLFETEPGSIQSLQESGKKVVCYINAGAWEEWVPDRDDFPLSVIGKDYEGWDGEKWLDIRAIEILSPIMEKRIKLCEQKGFDGIEFDNLEGYTNDSGFPLTALDQIKFNRHMADLAHASGLPAALKNSPELAAELQPYFDWVVVESCDLYDECGSYSAFKEAEKLVVVISYQPSSFDRFCNTVLGLGFHGILKNRELDPFRRECSQ